LTSKKPPDAASDAPHETDSSNRAHDDCATRFSAVDTTQQLAAPLDKSFAREM